VFASLPHSSHLLAWSSGTATGLGLFAVVGAQSAFILRQGMMRAHVGWVIVSCALIDVLFIVASVTSLQTLTHYVPSLTQYVLWLGVVFLIWYALQSARRAWRPGTGLAPANQTAQSRQAAMVGAVAFSLLNPHFWLDMVVIGSLANGFQQARLAFASGAITASVLWLIVLGCGATLLAPLLQSTRAWRVLDASIAVIMLALAARLGTLGYVTGV